MVAIAFFLSQYPARWRVLLEVGCRYCGCGAEGKDKELGENEDVQAVGVHAGDVRWLEFVVLWCVFGSRVWEHVDGQGDVLSRGCCCAVATSRLEHAHA